MNSASATNKRVTIASTGKKTVASQVNTPTGAQQNPARPGEQGFNPVRFLRHIDNKSPQYTGKKWRQNPVTGEYTRKKYRLEGFQIKRNPSRLWVNEARNGLKGVEAHFDGPKVAAACQYLELDKISDTKIWREHLAVLTQARDKLGARQAYQQETLKVNAAKERLEAAKQEIRAAQIEIRDQARQRQHQMMAVRREALSRGQSKGGQTAAAETAKRLKAAAMKPQTQPTAAEVAPPARESAIGKDDKRGKLQALNQKAKRNLGKAVKKTVQKAKLKSADQNKVHRATASAKALAKKPVLSLDRDALGQWVFGEAARLGMHPNELIEQWLIDDSVGAYLSDEQFAALRSLYVRLGNQHLQHVDAELNKQLEPLRTELKERVAAQNQAQIAYDNLPDPG